ncbi:hypothetical protein EVAR_35585_1 [Eumeta japonica]|uniref:Uncharacterized protein n=1 Tax=Eumeta variegata TaxID=151549 RepID=A0A4C1XJT8_EUMVA|nr:hypothetical protein EVAR_35585_1 [Eumeta japonica]
MMLNSLTPPLDLRLNLKIFTNRTPPRGPSPPDPSGRIFDEKTPGHEAIISPPSRTCDQEKRSRMIQERTNYQFSLASSSVAGAKNLTPFQPPPI